MYQFVKPFLDKKCLFLRNMEPLIEVLNFCVKVYLTEACFACAYEFKMDFGDKIKSMAILYR